MRILTIAAAALMLAGCASAVYDSLDRRGVDAKTVLIQRVTELRADAAAAKSGMDGARTALAAIDGLEGAALARQIDRARAAGEDAALAAQGVRLSADSMKTAAGRYFAAREEELGLLKTSEANLRAAKEALARATGAYRAYVSTLDAASLRLSPALSLYDAEVTALRKSPTSAAAAAARAGERANALAAALDAGNGLVAATNEADRFLETLE